MTTQSSSKKTAAATTFRAGIIQMCSSRDVDQNIADATALIEKAAAQGAQYIQTPEVTTFLDLDREALLRTCQPQSANAALTDFQELAAKLKIWFHIGSMSVLLESIQSTDTPTDPTTPDQRFANRSFLIAPDGTINAQYDKIHMFNVDLPNGESYSESDNFRPGDKAVVAKTPWGGLGMTICYDLRFPHLHRALAQAGANFIAVPAAFTVPTGLAHWHTLLRARAIETQCYVFAAAQGGEHAHGRATFGHSMIVSPWGEILAELDTLPGVITLDIDLERITEVRARVPSLTHDRPFEIISAMTADPKQREAAL